MIGLPITRALSVDVLTPASVRRLFRMAQQAPTTSGRISNPIKRLNSLMYKDLFHASAFVMSKGQSIAEVPFDSVDAEA